MADDLLLLDEPVPGVRRLRMHRPEVLNALNLSLRRALAAAFTAADVDDAVRVVVLAGGERAFCAGADLAEYRDATPSEIVARRMGPLWDAVAQCRKPVIAVVRGHALGGGCELALHADLIVAGERASFGQPEVLVGLMPGGGATQRLPRTIGKFAAMRLLLTGQSVPAYEALSLGLVTEVVADDQAESRALELAARLAQGPQAAVRAIKAAVLASHAMLHEGLEHERRSFVKLFAEPDTHEGITARLEKRRPVFQ